MDAEITKSFEATETGPISIEEMSKPEDGINIVVVQLQEAYILAVDRTTNGFAIYKTNAHFDSALRVEVHWIHKIEFIIESN